MRAPAYAGGSFGVIQLLWARVALRRGLALGLAIEAILLVAAVGPLSLLAHGRLLLDLGALTNYEPAAALVVTLAIVALFAFYGLALRAMPSGGWAALAVALGFSAVFSATLIFVYPALAVDVYNYAVQGHVAAFDQLNPLVDAPTKASGDPFVSYAGSWGSTSSPYGPLWVALTTLTGRLAGSNIVLAVALLKLVSALAVTATASLIAWSLRAQGSRAAVTGAIVYGWNPLVLIELVGNGHNDALMALFLIVALVALGRNRPVLGALSLGVSILIKYLTLGALPFLLLAPLLDRRQSWRARLGGLGLSVGMLIAVVAAAYAPYWVGWQTLTRVLASENNYVSSIPALLILVVPSSFTWLIIPRLAILFLVGLYQCRALILQETTPARATFESLFALLLVSPHFAGWYIASLVALAGLIGDRWIQLRAGIFAFTAFLTVPLWEYVWWWDRGWLSLEQFHFVLVPLIFLPPLAVVAWPWLRARLRRPSSSSLFSDLPAACMMAPVRFVIIGNFGLADKGTMLYRALPIGRALVRRGHRVTVIVPGAPVIAGGPTDPDVITIGVPSRRGPFGHVLLVARMLWIAWRLRPDIVYAFKPKAYAGLTLAAFWLLRRLALYQGRIVLDTDDWEGDGGWNDRLPGSWLQKRFVAWHERWCLRRSDLVTAASRALVELAAASGAPRVVYLPNTIDAASPTARVGDGRKIRTQLGLGDWPVVLVFTRFVEFAPERLADVFGVIRAAVPQAILLVVGRGLNDEDEVFRRSVGRRGLDDAVVAVGWVNPVDVPDYLAAGDLALYLLDDTLLNRTKCPLKLLDLLAAGQPVVVDAVGQASEYIRSGENGVLVPSGDVSSMASWAVELLGDPEQRRQVGAAAVARLRGQTWDGLVEAVEWG